MPNRGKTKSAGKPAGGIKGDIPLGEGAIGPGVEKGAGGAIPADHVKTRMPRRKDDLGEDERPSGSTKRKGS
jgi:hypothetical protein